MPVEQRHVKTIRKAGDTKLKKDVTLTGGTNVTLTQSGQDISIAAAAGGDTNDNVVTVHPGVGFSDNAVNPDKFFNGGSEIPFSASSTKNWYTTAKVPSGMTSISSVRVYFTGESTGNVYLKFISQSINVDETEVATEDSSDSNTAYPSGSSDGSVEFFTVPAAAYNLIEVVENYLVSVRIIRSAGDSLDTYNTEWNTVAMEYTFA